MGAALSIKQNPPLKVKWDLRWIAKRTNSGCPDPQHAGGFSFIPPKKDETLEKGPPPRFQALLDSQCRTRPKDRFSLWYASNHKGVHGESWPSQIRTSQKPVFHTLCPCGDSFWGWGPKGKQKETTPPFPYVLLAPLFFRAGGVKGKSRGHHPTILRPRGASTHAFGLRPGGSGMLGFGGSPFPFLAQRSETRDPKPDTGAEEGRPARATKAPSGGGFGRSFRRQTMSLTSRCYRDPDASYTDRTLQLVNGGFNLYVGGTKCHVSNGCKMYPCVT